MAVLEKGAIELGDVARNTAIMHSQTVCCLKTECSARGRWIQGKHQSTDSLCLMPEPDINCSEFV